MTQDTTRASRARKTESGEGSRSLTLIDLWNRVYDVLVEFAGAIERDREPFVAAHMDPRDDMREWRFMGRLGFGGKFWARRMVVTCYSEDETHERKRIISRTNEALAAIQRQATANGRERL